MLIRHRRHRNVEHPIYTTDEAVKLGLNPVPWRDAISNAWGITDDGYVALCLARNEYTSKRGSATHLRFTIGGVWLNKTAQLLWLARKISKCHGSGTKTWMDLEMRRARFKNLVGAYAMMRVNGKLDWEALGRIYRRNDPMRVESAKRILRRPEAKVIIEEAVRVELLGSVGTGGRATRKPSRVARVVKHNDAAKVDPTTHRGVGPPVGLESQPEEGECASRAPRSSTRPSLARRGRGAKTPPSVGRSSPRRRIFIEIVEGSHIVIYLKEPSK
jgi:hypothetical protein